MLNSDDCDPHDFDLDKLVNVPVDDRDDNDDADPTRESALVSGILASEARCPRNW